MLNLILAICAVCISAASFYATYLQAQSAEKQVKAMTMPLLEFSSSNYNDEKERQEVIFEVHNAGVGPAIIKQVKYTYQQQDYFSIASFMYHFYGKSSPIITGKVDKNFATGNLTNHLIPGQSATPVFSFELTDANKSYWKEINDARWEMNVEICYCSLLDECYITNEKKQIKPIAACLIKPQ